MLYDLVSYIYLHYTLLLYPMTRSSIFHGSTNSKVLHTSAVGTGVWMMGSGGACAVLASYPIQLITGSAEGAALCGSARVSLASFLISRAAGPRVELLVYGSINDRTKEQRGYNRVIKKGSTHGTT